MSALLGSPKAQSHGLCWKLANQLSDAWRRQGIAATVTLAVLVPDWRPDVVWKGGAVRITKHSMYARPLAALGDFLATGQSLASSGRFKYERAFGQLLEDLQADCRLRTLASAREGLRFRVMTTRAAARTGEFEVNGLE